jgi:aspartate-semialdehyde dehydrogenase
VVPEINADALDGHHGLIANPNCTTITFLVPLAALHRKWGIAWASVASYQSISGGGTAPYEAFRLQMAEAALDGKSSDAGRLPYNVIPAVGGFNAEGWTSEETKMRLESRKILGDDTVTVFGTAVRVPTLIGHLCATHVQLASAPASLEEVRDTIATFPGVVLQDDPAAGIWPTPVSVAGTDPVAVGRIRMLDERTVGFVSAADNLRKGAALNAVQIADALLARG